MFLSRILEAKRLEVARRRKRTPQWVLERRAGDASEPRDFLAGLTRPGLGVIGEVKRASPSRGPLRPDLDAPALARQYESAGCIAVSVLTDVPHFGALPDDLEQVRTAVSVPVLRKDFVISEYQLWESRAMGADAVLLIVAALEPESLGGLVDLADRLGMCPLVEVHGPEEVEIALRYGARAVGINNRDLRSFRVDLETTRRLRRAIPANVAVVSESGISTPRDAALVREWGADAVLVGEALVTSADPGGLIQTWRAIR